MYFKRTFEMEEYLRIGEDLNSNVQSKRPWMQIHTLYLIINVKYEYMLIFSFTENLNLDKYKTHEFMVYKLDEGHAKRVFGCIVRPCIL